jgi:hypothetical protein
MGSIASDFESTTTPATAIATATIQDHLERVADELLASLPEIGSLTTAGRRGIIARYTAVLEGNFIYWMTGAYLAARTDQARAIIQDNLHEEVRDAHPAMMRRFAIAAHAIPTDADAQAVYQNLSQMRRFIGRLSPIPLLVTMAFFEGFIQRFMPYLADLAKGQGSSELEYTDVHGVCDIEHTQGLFRALDAEMALESGPAPAPADLFEGVRLLRALINNIIVA